MPESKIDLSILWYILDKVAKVLLVLGALLLLVYGLYRLITSGTIRAFFSNRILSQFLRQLISDIKDFFRMIFHFKFEKEAAYARLTGEAAEALTTGLLWHRQNTQGL